MLLCKQDQIAVNLKDIKVFGDLLGLLNVHTWRTEKVKSIDQLGLYVMFKSKKYELSLKDEVDEYEEIFESMAQANIMVEVKAENCPTCLYRAFEGKGRFQSYGMQFCSGPCLMEYSSRQPRLLKTDFYTKVTQTPKKAPQQPKKAPQLPVIEKKSKKPKVFDAASNQIYTNCVVRKKIVDDDEPPPLIAKSALLLEDD